MPSESRVLVPVAAIIMILVFTAIMFAGFFIPHSSASSQIYSIASTNVSSITLNSPHPRVSGFFGWSVATSANIVVVGAPLEGANSAGHAYVFNGFQSVIILSSSNPIALGQFGWSVAINGNLVVVGANSETANGHSGAGHAYIFDASTGNLIRTLTSPSAQSNAQFGNSVAISSSTIVVGAPCEKVDGIPCAGHAYIFSTATGKLIKTLSSPNPYFDGNFGWSVATNGKTVAVGAPFEPDGHVYTYNATTGKLVGKLTTPNPQFAGNFGYSVAMTSDVIVVGAIGENVNGFHFAGQAYTFYESTGKLIKTLNSPNDQDDEFFGISVSISDTTVVVGAGNDHAYIFMGLQKIEQVRTLSSPNEFVSGNFGFGNSVALSGNIAVVGAFGEKSSGFSQAGHAYIFFD